MLSGLYTKRQWWFHKVGDIIEFYQKSLNIKETADYFNLPYRYIYRVVNKNKTKKYQSEYLLKNKDKIYQKNKKVF